MKRRVRPLLCLSLCALGLALPLSSIPAFLDKSRPNLLLITIDTLRADRVGFYGKERLKTPHLDALAEKSVVFTRAFANTPTTLPAHANILLGTAPAYHGVHDNANFIVRKEFLTLAEHLKSFGYSTGAFVGGFPLESRFGLTQGFDIYDDDFSHEEPGIEKGRERRAQLVVDKSLLWMTSQISPWFLWIHCFDPHDPYTPPEPYKTLFAQNPYDGEVAYTDSVMGNLFSRLDESGLLSKTIVVFTGDHGESLGEHGEKTHGYLTYNTTLWIPLMIFVPGSEHRTISQNVSHLDIFPTVCDLLGIEKPVDLQGSSLLPLLRGRRLKEEAIFFECLSPYYNMGWAPIIGYIRGNEKFTHSPIPELYDLDTDFDENKSLAGNTNLKKYEKRLDQISRQLSSPESRKAEQRADRETLERLKSLGYLASLQGSKKHAFGPDDDVKTLLPYHNRSMEALELWRAGNAAGAVTALKEVITAKKNISTAYLNLAAIYRGLERADEAVIVLETGLEALPENYDLFSQLISYLYDAGRIDEVILAFESKNFDQIELDPVIWNYAGLAYWKKNELAKAIGCYNQSLAIDPEFAVPYVNLGNLYAFDFRKTSKPEALEKAVENFTKAIALDSSSSAAFHGLGVTFFYTKNFQKAITCLEKALVLDPGLDEALHFLGLACLAEKDYEQAYMYLMKYKNSPAYSQLSPAEKARLDESIAASRNR